MIEDIDAYNDSQVQHIARVCHEANRAYCLTVGDTSQVAWDDAPDWQRASAVEGVRKALWGATPRQLHDSWCDAKYRDGWQYGPVKDADAKTHPCLVPYSQLPVEQKRKDALFGAIVGALATMLVVTNTDEAPAHVD